MKKPLNEFEFTLNNSVNFDHQGDQETGFKLILKAPGNIHARFCMKLSKNFFASAKSMSEIHGSSNKPSSPSSTDDSDGMTGEMIAMAMLNYGDGDAVYDAFKDLMCFVTPQKSGSVCLVEGKCMMTKSIYEQMSLADTNRLLGEYLKNFLIPS